MKSKKKTHIRSRKNKIRNVSKRNKKNKRKSIKKVIFKGGSNNNKINIKLVYQREKGGVVHHVPDKLTN